MKKALLLIFTSILMTSCYSDKYILLEAKVSNLENEVKFLKEQNRQQSIKINEYNRNIKSLENKINFVNDKIKNDTLYYKSTKSNVTTKSASKKARKKTYRQRKKTYSQKPSKTYSGRCQAITKKGTQCKRNASEGSIYCWQHGG